MRTALIAMSACFVTPFAYPIKRITVDTVKAPAPKWMLPVDLISFITTHVTTIRWSCRGLNRHLLCAWLILTALDRMLSQQEPCTDPSFYDSLPVEHRLLNDNHLKGTLPTELGALTDLWLVYVAGGSCKDRKMIMVGVYCTWYRKSNATIVACDYCGATEPTEDAQQPRRYTRNHDPHRRSSWSHVLP